MGGRTVPLTKLRTINSPGHNPRVIFFLRGLRRRSQVRKDGRQKGVPPITHYIPHGTPKKYCPNILFSIKKEKKALAAAGPCHNSARFFFNFGRGFFFFI